MKTLLTFVVLLLSYNGNQMYNPVPDFIEIKHTGMEEKPVKTLIISTEEINKGNLKLRADYDETLTSAQRDAMIALQYNFLITDDVTYTSIIDFCNNNQSYFTNTIRRNHGDYRDYSIRVKGKVYNIFYKSKDQFFNQLIKYIRTKNGDKSLTKEIGAY